MWDIHATLHMSVLLGRLGTVRIDVGEGNEPTQNSLHWARSSACAYIAISTLKLDEQEATMGA